MDEEIYEKYWEPNKDWFPSNFPFYPFERALVERIGDVPLENDTGERVVDFQRSNLHVLNYSIPINRKMSLAELRPHLFTLPEAPDWIPYRASYYRETWGVCLTQRQLESMREGEYEVSIDSTLEPGHLTYGEYRIQGAADDEVLISCHACHPSLCNDNLSGISVAARLAGLLQAVFVSAGRTVTFC
jgi:aminopeptidase-like protein